LDGHILPHHLQKLLVILGLLITSYVTPIQVGWDSSGSPLEFAPPPLRGFITYWGAYSLRSPIPIARDGFITTAPEPAGAPTPATPSPNPQDPPITPYPPNPIGG